MALASDSPGRARPAAKNALFSVGGFLYTGIVALAVTPVVLHFLGIEQYGIYALATAFIGFLGVMDLGMSPTIVKFVAHGLAQDDLERANRAIGSGLVVLAIVGLVGFLVAVAAGLFLPSLFNIASQYTDEARFAFIASGAGFLFLMLQIPARTVPGTVQRFDVGAAVLIALTTATAAGTVLVLVLGGGLRGIVAVTALLQAVGILAYWRAARALVPELRLRPSWDRELVREMLSFGGFAFIGNFSGLILFQLDRLVLGAYSGPRAVTFYTVPGLIAQRLHAAAAYLSVVGLPAASELMALGHSQAVNRLYVRAIRLVSLFVLSVAVPCIVYADPILSTWVGEDIAREGATVLQLLLVTYGILAITAVPYYVMLGRGQPGIPAGFNVVTAVTNVALMLILIPPMGVLGAAWAFLGSMVFTLPYLWYVERKHLELTVTPWVSICRDFAAPVAIQVVCCFALRPLIGGIASLLVILAATIPVTLLAYMATGRLDAVERDLLRSLWPRASAGG